MSIVLDALICVTGWAHVVVAPYTKVEESFNIHATHDVLMYGVGSDALQNYDHFVFPGAVPRTFVGSVILAWLTAPAVWLTAQLGYMSNKLDIQILARLVLASLNAWILCLIRRGTSRRFGRVSGLFFVLLTCSQFHYPFWMGRTIPNMFATIPVNISTYLLLDRGPARSTSHKSLVGAISLLTFTAVVFRAEVALLLGPLALQFLSTGKMTFSSLLKVGIVSGLLSLALTTAIDSYFWDKYPLWPEFSGIYFNVIEGKSAEWGTSPPLTYVTSYLPKLLLGALPLALVGFVIDPRIRALLLSPVIFIGLISCLGHKEWRFIIYIVPAFNIAAARAARWMVSLPKSSLVGRLFFFIPIGLVLLNVLITLLFTQASMANYPGGQALSLFHQLYPAATTYPTPHVHISNLAAQTGATLFLQINAPPYYPATGSATGNAAWVYNKTENLSPAALSAFSAPFTHLISEISPAQDATLHSHWKVAGAVTGFDRWAVDWTLIKGKRRGELLERIGDVLRMEKTEKLWILERQ